MYNRDIKTQRTPIRKIHFPGLRSKTLYSQFAVNPDSVKIFHYRFLGEISIFDIIPYRLIAMKKCEQFLPTSCPR